MKKIIVAVTLAVMAIPVLAKDDALAQQCEKKASFAGLYTLMKNDGRSKDDLKRDISGTPGMDKNDKKLYLEIADVVYSKPNNMSDEALIRSVTEKCMKDGQSLFTKIKISLFGM